MQAVGNSCCFITTPLENMLLKKKMMNKNMKSCPQNNHVMVCHNNHSRLGKICCKLSGSDIEEQNPQVKVVTKPKNNKMEEYNTAMKRMMRNPYEYHHDLGQ